MFINAGNKRVRGLQVNPQWTDWLMGFPINHTALDAQEILAAVRENNEGAE